MKWCQRRPPIWPWRPDMASTVSVHLSKPYSGILAICGCMYTSYIATLNPTFCVFLFLLFKLLPPPTPPLHPSLPPTPPLHPSLPPTHQPSYIRWPNVNEFHESIIKTGKNQPLFTCQVSCTKANRLLISIIILSE